MRPWVFLDVDGALAPFADEPVSDFDDWVPAPGAGFILPLSATMAGRLAALEADLVWLTTWEAQANTVVGAALGWPELPVALASRGDDADRWWKAAALFDWLAEHGSRSFVWVDDDINEHLTTELGRPSALARQLQQLNVPYLLVSTNRDEGLDAAQLAQIEAFVADCTGVVASG